MTTAIPDLVLLGGVPGAGKSTALRAVASCPGITVRDPECVQRRLAALLPATAPYRSYRLLVHLAHTSRVVADLLAGPSPERTLVVHDPGTGRHRRPLFARLARLRGWRTVSVWIDVDRETAHAGQVQRGRIINPVSFERHWARWQRMRPTLRAADPAAAVAIVVSRDTAADTLVRLCGRPVAEELRTPGGSDAWGRVAIPSTP